jgi:hypothetical protein
MKKTFNLEELKDVLMPYEAKRKEIKQQVLVINTITLFVVLFLMGLYQNVGYIFAMFLFSTAFGYNFYLSYVFEKEFNEDVVRKMLLSLDRSYRFIEESYIDLNHYYNSKLFPLGDRYFGHSYTLGVYKGLDFEFSNLLVSYIDYQKNVDEIKYRETLLNGLFVVIHLREQIKGEVQIRTEGKPFGIGFRKVDASELFGQTFDVYVKGNVSPKVLNSKRTSEMLHIYKKYSNKDIYISISENKLYLAIQPFDYGIVPNVFKSILKEQEIHRVTESFEMIMELIDSLIEDHS